MAEIDDAELARLRESDRNYHELRKSHDDLQSNHDKLNNEFTALNKASEKSAAKITEYESELSGYRQKENFDNVYQDLEGFAKESIKEERAKDPSTMDLDMQFVRPYADRLSKLDFKERESEPYKKELTAILGEAYRDQEETFSKYGLTGNPTSGPMSIPSSPAPSTPTGSPVPQRSQFSPGEYMKQRTKNMGAGFAPVEKQG